MTSPTRTLFDTPTLARRSDPPSARTAAERVTESRTAAIQRERVLAAQIANPGATAAEIAAISAMDRHDPSRRLLELRRAGVLINGEEGICRVIGSPSLTWYPVDHAIPSDAIPNVMTPAMIEMIHKAFDRRPPTGEEILRRRAEARDRMDLAEGHRRNERIMANVQGTVPAGAGRGPVPRAGHRADAEVPHAVAAGVRPAMHQDHPSSRA